MKEGYKKTELGWIPEEWEVRKIGDISQVTKLAGFEFTEYIEYRDDGEIIALRALNIKNGKLNLVSVYLSILVLSPSYCHCGSSVTGLTFIMGVSTFS